MTITAKSQVLTIGESMLALRADSAINLGPIFNSSIAGAESNVAIGLSRLGHRVSWAGLVGSDPHGDLIRRTLYAERVDFLGGVDPNHPTGIMLTEPRLSTTTRVTYQRSSSAGSKLQFSDVEKLLTRDLLLIHLTGITPALSDTAAECIEMVIDRAKQVGVKVSFDINFRSKLWSESKARGTLSNMVSRADIVIGSPGELELIGQGSAQDIALKLLADSAEWVAVKNGADGAIVYHGENATSVSAHKVLIADTVGAGDAFTAGFLSGYLDSLTPEAAAKRGVACAAFSISSRGDWEGLPTRQDLELLDLEPGGTER
ncbi:sugar kinase [Aquiluna sp. Uisw_065]|uniref:sugar kinase n=1 Tax=Aquiluna sp. Uisw_065 TaxID=3230967 RepID=UPI0039EB9092